MYRTKHDWRDYCKAMNRKEDDPIMKTPYFMRGFQTWLKLRDEFRWYDYNARNC